MDQAAGDPGGGDGHRAEAGGLVLGSAGGVERVGVEEDQVGGHAGVHRTLAVDGGGQRLLRGERLLGVPGGAFVGGAVHGGGDRQPRVER